MLPREKEAIDPSLIDIYRELVIGRRPWPLFLHGRPGVGKTCAALWLVDFVRSGIYTTQGALIDKYRLGRKKFMAEPYRPEDWFHRVRCGLLVLDELGAVMNERDESKASSDDYNTLIQILDLRERTPLILVSNLNLARIEEFYDDRIASRCGAGTWFELKGPDRRIRKGK